MISTSSFLRVCFFTIAWTHFSILRSFFKGLRTVLVTRGTFRFTPVHNFATVSWKRCATGFEIVFSCLVGVSNVSPINSNMYINHAVLKIQLAQELGTRDGL